MKRTQKKKIITEKILRTNESDNSFLIETSFNSDIDLNVRNEIESKYKRSKMNSEYIFPRILPSKKTSSKQISKKNSFESLGKFVTRHKQSRSSIQPLNTDSRIEKQSSAKPNLSIKIPVQAKHDQKRNLSHYRGISYRQIKTDRNRIKSPKSTKNFVEIYAKNASSKKVGTSDFTNKIFKPYNANNKILGSTGSVRLKKIFYNVKNNQIN